MRLIDADALIPMIKYATIDNEIGVFPIRIGFDAIVKVINEQPTIEAVPERKRGRWIEKKVTDDSGAKIITQWQSAKCSVCGLYHTTPYLYYFKESKYCPNCGAHMDEVTE